MTQPVTAPPACAATRARLMRHLIEDRQLLLCEALRVLGRRDRAEDVMQDAALRCLESRAIPDRIDSAPGFLRRMVRNLAIDQLRREARQPTETLEPDLDCASAADDPAGRLAGRQALRVVAGALDGLPPRTREAFLRHRLDGQSQKRVAADLDLSTARVCGMIAEATRATRAALDGADAQALPRDVGPQPTRSGRASALRARS